MKSVYRVAVIEVGSRAIRLLVADVSPEGMLQNVLTSWKEMRLADGVDGNGTSGQTIEDAKEHITHFMAIAREKRPARVVAFGTEAVRRLTDVEINAIRKACPDFRVLSKREEAELSFLAGVMEIPAANCRGASSLVVDQGSRSMEVVTGTLEAEEVRIQDNRSYKLGTLELVGLLNRVGTLGRLRDELEERFARYKPLLLSTTSRPIVLGSAATRLAWLTVRGNDIARMYDPREIHGRIMRVSYIDVLIRLAEADPASARVLIQPRDPNTPDFERVVTGLVALKVLLKREGRDQFVVSCKGTRYGLVWKLAFGEGLNIG